MFFLAFIAAISNEIAISTFLQFNVINFSDSAGGTHQHRVDCFVPLCAHYFSYGPPRMFIAAELEEPEQQSPQQQSFPHSPPKPKI